MVSPLQRKLQKPSPVGGGASVDVYQRGRYDPSGDGMYSNRTVMPSGGMIGPAGVIPTQQSSPMMQGAVMQPRPDVIPRQTMTTMQQPSQPKYGLSGTESALQAGLYGGLDALGQGYGSALNQLGGAQQRLSDAGQSIRGDINAGLGLLGQAGQQGAGAISSGTGQGLGMLSQAGGQANNMLGQGFGILSQAGGQAGGMINQGVNALSGDYSADSVDVDPMTGQPMFRRAAGGVGRFAGAGLSAQQQQAALSGALGRDAQQQAFNSYVESPEQAFLREQGEQSVINQAAATGGLTGGNVLKELQRFGTGLAAQDYQNSFNRLGSLSNQGLQAAGQQGQFLSQAGQQQGQLAGQNAQLGTQANLSNAANRLQAAGQQAQLYGQGAGIASNLGQAGANLSGQGAGIAANLGQAGAGLAQQGGLSIANLLQQSAGQGASLIGQGAGLQSGLAQQGAQLGQFGAGLGMQGGTTAANMFGQTGANIANARTRAGEQLSSNIAGITGAQSGLINQQGSGLADILGQSGINIGNLISGAGQQLGGQQMDLAQLLANLAVGQGGQLSSSAQQMGAANATSALQQGANMNNLLSNLTQAYGYYQGQQPTTTG